MKSGCFRVFPESMSSNGWPDLVRLIVSEDEGIERSFVLRSRAKKIGGVRRKLPKFGQISQRKAAALLNGGRSAFNEVQG